MAEEPKEQQSPPEPENQPDPLLGVPPPPLKWLEKEAKPGDRPLTTGD